MEMYYSPTHLYPKQQENSTPYPPHITYSPYSPQIQSTSYGPYAPYTQYTTYLVYPAYTAYTQHVTQSPTTHSAQTPPHTPYTPEVPRTPPQAQYTQYTQEVPRTPPHTPHTQYTPYILQKRNAPYLAQTPTTTNRQRASCLPYTPRRITLPVKSSVARAPSKAPPTKVVASSLSLSEASKRSVIINDPSRILKVKFSVSESELAHRLRPHIIELNRLQEYGFPVHSAGLKGCIEFHRVMVGPESKQTDLRVAKRNAKQNQDGSFNFFQTPVCLNFDWTNVGDQIFAQRQCTRCQRAFHVSRSGEYLNQESCTYHPNKLESLSKNTCNLQYGCCGQPKNSKGCSYGDAHVWSGTVMGLNGPYTDFMQTPHRSLNGSPTNKVYALDCEMSFTGRGLEVTKISIMDFQGEVAYEHYVRPDSKIVDYNSRFSGITEKDLNPNSGNSIKSLAEVHRDLLQLFNRDTILIGHGLENDLRALRLVHKTIVDTSIVFPHSRGYPYKKSLKSLAAEVLKQEIQCGDAGHSCLEDAQACLELMLFKVHEEKQQANGRNIMPI